MKILLDNRKTPKSISSPSSSEEIFSYDDDFEDERESQKAQKPKVYVPRDHVFSIENLLKKDKEPAAVIPEVKKEEPPKQSKELLNDTNQEIVIPDKIVSRKRKLEPDDEQPSELFELEQDLKSKISELKENLIPMFISIKLGEIPQSESNDSLIEKTKLYIKYCSYLIFYFVVKTGQDLGNNLTIAKSILRFKNVIF